MLLLREYLMQVIDRTKGNVGMQKRGMTLKECCEVGEPTLYFAIKNFLMHSLVAPPLRVWHRSMQLNIEVSYPNHKFSLIL